MKKSHIKTLFGAIGTSLIILSSPVYAAFSWNNGGGGQCGVSFSCDRSATINGTNIGVSVTGLQANDVNTALSTSRVNVWSGLAVQAGNESYGGAPEHATDANGRKESLLFSFSRAVALTQITMGWIGGYNNADADFSLLRYTGGSSTVTGQSYNSLVSSGSWELVGNSLYNGGYVDGSGSTANVNSAGKTSSLWLVAALNSAYWSNSNYIGNDFFKLQSINATYTAPSSGVPEPSTLALMSLSFAAFGFTRRKRRISAS